MRVNTNLIGCNSTHPDTVSKSSDWDALNIPVIPAWDVTIDIDSPRTDLNNVNNANKDIGDIKSYSGRHR